MLSLSLPNPPTASEMWITLCLLLGAATLAIEPAMWLLQTWYAPGYESFGLAAFGLCALLFLASWISPLKSDAELAPTSTWWGLLLLTALLRGMSQWLDINVLGALLLSVDVYVLANLARLPQRRFALAPLWLGMLFCFALPIEPMVQRVIGFGLQQVSAQIACGLLTVGFDQVQCEGVRLILQGQDVLVDLPCSGAQLLSMSAMLLVAGLSVRPVRLARLPGLLLLWLAASLLVNGLRIAVLAAGIAFPPDFDVMAPLPHNLIGLGAVLLVGSVIVMALCAPSAVPVRPIRLQRRLRWPLWARGSAASCFFGFALLVGAIQPQPVDASLPGAPPNLPRFAADFLSQPVPLSVAEQRYFTQYGGSASRANYGPYGLLLVNTASPLRHLHDPAVCWRGLGYDVQLLGTDHLHRTTVYRASPPTPDDAQLLLRVSYISEQGVRANSIAEVVWRWFDRPEQRWTMVQRIVPVHTENLAATAQWENAIERAFNL